jgi:hypothetical protein
MKRLLLIPILLLTSCSLFKEDPIYYVHTRPPSSYSGTIGDDGFFYYFTNSADRFNDEICKIRIDGACFVKTDVPAKIIKKGIMKTTNMYWCSEAVIKEARKTQTLSPRNYSGYGICTEKGWIFE